VGLSPPPLEDVGISLFRMAGRIVEGLTQLTEDSAVITDDPEVSLPLEVF